MLFRSREIVAWRPDVLLSDIKFVGPLSFVETLKDLIPLDGFSDPPYLDITPQGIDAGFSQGLPNIAVGMFSISNISLGAGFVFVILFMGIFYGLFGWFANAGIRLRPSMGVMAWPLNSCGYLAPLTSTHVAMMSMR
mgnify:CR=1 FL=1